MEKKLIKKTIFDESKGTPFTWKDIKEIGFEDNDFIQIQWNESYYSENESYDGHYSATVVREVLETDDEFKKRIEESEFFRASLKARRYEQYLKLKKEFES